MTTSRRIVAADFYLSVLAVLLTASLSLAATTTSDVSRTDGASTVSPATRHVAYYKSTMMKGESSPTAKLDSMGMDMVPVYEDEKSSGSSTAKEMEQKPPAAQAILKYKSTMMDGETSSTPKKDSMGMDMVPVYEDNASSTNAPASPTPIKQEPAGAHRIKYYKSTMAPGEISQTPKKDSMGMDMVAVYEDEDQSASSTIRIDPVTQQNMGVRTARVIRGPLRRVIRTLGIFDYNETTLTEITTKFGGWIEKLYVDSTGKQVRAGDPLFQIYSPDLYKTQFEYVQAANATVKAASGTGGSLKDMAAWKLKLLDVPDDEIKALEKTRQPQRTVRINAPRDGIVIEKIAVQGMKVEPGQRLYRIADLSTVWLLAQVYEQDLPFIKINQAVTVSLPYDPGRKSQGKITYIYPWLDEKTRTAKLRIEFQNTDRSLKPGMYANLNIESEVDPSVILVPDMAVLRSGERNTVFVATDGGRFDPRDVVIGLRSEDNQYQVLKGLKEGEIVVTSGQFLLDSESQLREAVQKMLEPKAMPQGESTSSSPAAVEKSSASPAHQAHGS